MWEMLLGILPFPLVGQAECLTQSGLTVLARKRPLTMLAPFLVSLLVVCMNVMPLVMTSSMRMMFLPATSLVLMLKFSAGLVFLPVMWPDSWSWIGRMVC